jgi:hypothetical protein
MYKLSSKLLKNHVTFFMFISFASPKETNQRKRARKRKPCPFFPPATQGHIGATKKGEVRTFSGLPAHVLRP